MFMFYPYPFISELGGRDKNIFERHCIVKGKWNTSRIVQDLQLNNKYCKE